MAPVRARSGHAPSIARPGHRLTLGPAQRHEGRAASVPEESVQGWRSWPVTVNGVDFVFRPQSTIYLLWALGDDETWRVIEAAHERAIERVLEWIEDEVAVIHYGRAASTGCGRGSDRRTVPVRASSACGPGSAGSAFDAVADGEAQQDGFGQAGGHAREVRKPYRTAPSSGQSARSWTSYATSSHASFCPTCQRRWGRPGHRHRLSFRKELH
ncbi:relaxase domain-containing protein [Streptomyces sp. NPDC127038]|uniref:relaxase domain-containing protein n=1 Tax=Streptomyces sp. NPDC127038 TaxID=3347114 RepID=UPI00365AFA1F